ncbi:MAG: hypothetical protein HQL69_20940 [Magnetococcales bacterium]|nr:hypothetical protein [Magnetococcales bacterium]
MGRKLRFFQFISQFLFSYILPAEKVINHKKEPIGLIVKTDGCQEVKVIPKANSRVILIGNGERANIPDSEYIYIHDPALYSTHCMLTHHQASGWKIERLNCDYVRSTAVNGVMLNSPKNLSNGDLIRAGNTTLNIKIG